MKLMPGDLNEFCDNYNYAFDQLQDMHTDLDELLAIVHDATISATWVNGLYGGIDLTWDVIWMRSDNIIVGNEEMMPWEECTDRNEDLHLALPDGIIPLCGFMKEYTAGLILMVIYR